MITKSEEHDINRAGKRLFRDALESVGWVVNEVQEDYGIDYDVQVFDERSPTGAWFHAQLKSSASSGYAADGTFLSQELSIDHARHYALEMRNPILVVHADVISNRVYWYAPQLDLHLAATVGRSDAKSVTLRIPTSQQLPATAPKLLASMDRIYLTLSNRELTSASIPSFAESLKHIPDQAALHHAFQQKNDTLKLEKIRGLYQEGKLEEARPRAEAILTDPDSTVEVKFWARIQLQSIDFSQTHHSGKPQSELPKVMLKHAQALQNLTRRGPKYLKFYSLIARHAAELDVLAHENFGLFMALHQHLNHGGDPMMVLGLYARRSALTKRIGSKYNCCVRLVRYAMNYPDRWMLGRALTSIVNAIGYYLVTLRSEKNFEAEQQLAQSALQICKVAAWICEETRDAQGLELAIISALATTHSTDSDAYRWADEAARGFVDEQIRNDALLLIDRAVRRWRGEQVEGDYKGDVIWQITQNIATSLGIDLSNESDPFVQSLKIAAKDNSPERVLSTWEHALVSLGATGPRAQAIQQLFNMGTAGSKVVHCTLHNYHVEGKELDAAYEQFQRRHCGTCADRKPRPSGWRYTDEVRQVMEMQHSDFVRSLADTKNGFRYTSED